MATRTPLSMLAKAKPFTPAGLDSKAKPFIPAAAKVVAWVPMVLACSPDCHQQDAGSEKKPNMTQPQRGRASTQTEKMRLPSRTPSPCASSVCASEASTAVASWTTKDDSCSDISMPDLHDHGNDWCEAGNLPIKNTFLHFETVSAFTIEDSVNQPKSLRRCSSAPADLLTCTFQIKQPTTMEELHQRGECSPCAYFAIKADGCRQGSACKFCHLCPAEELKTRKKQRAKAHKEVKKALQALEAAEQYRTAW